MRLFDFALPLKYASRLLASVSVRTRIVVLALIPVAGFVAVGATYMRGEADVAAAFETVKRSSKLADASRDFETAVASMRIAVKDFTAAPSDELVIAFQGASVLAAQSLNIIDNAIDSNDS